MPATYSQKLDKATKVVVWNGLESEKDLQLSLPPQWVQKLPINARRKKEMLCARNALINTSPKTRWLQLNKDSFGKPQFVEKGLYFSWSHSHGHAAAICSDMPCGVDLQLRLDKIVKLRSKFENADEAKFINQQKDLVVALHILWGAKESLYKLWGKREIDWRKHLLVFPFDSNAKMGSFYGGIKIKDQEILATLWFEWIDDFCLVSAKEI